MKIGKGILSLLLISIIFSSCGLFKGGGKKCDCPKFSKQNEIPQSYPEGNSSASSLE